VKVLGFADDIYVMHYTTDIERMIESIQASRMEIARFSSYSGSILNKTKSKLFLIGSDPRILKQFKYAIIDSIGVECSLNEDNVFDGAVTIKILGDRICLDVDANARENAPFEDRFEMVNRSLVYTNNNIRTNFAGKRITFNMIHLPKIQFRVPNHSLSNYLIGSTKQLILQQMWKGKRHLIAYKDLFAPLSCGGLEVRDSVCSFLSLDSFWLRMIFTTEHNKPDVGLWLDVDIKHITTIVRSCGRLANCSTLWDMPYVCFVPDSGLDVDVDFYGGGAVMLDHEPTDLMPTGIRTSKQCFFSIDDYSGVSDNYSVTVDRHKLRFNRKFFKSVGGFNDYHHMLCRYDDILLRSIGVWSYIGGRTKFAYDLAFARLELLRECMECTVNSASRFQDGKVNNDMQRSLVKLILGGDAQAYNSKPVMDLLFSETSCVLGNGKVVSIPSWDHSRYYRGTYGLSLLLPVNTVESEGKGGDKNAVDDNTVRFSKDAWFQDFERGIHIAFNNLTTGLTNLAMFCIGDGRGDFIAMNLYRFVCAAVCGNWPHHIIPIINNVHVSHYHLFLYHWSFTWELNLHTLCWKRVLLTLEHRLQDGNFLGKVRWYRHEQIAVDEFKGFRTWQTFKAALMKGRFNFRKNLYTGPDKNVVCNDHVVCGAIQAVATMSKSIVHQWFTSDEATRRWKCVIDLSVDKTYAELKDLITRNWNFIPAGEITARKAYSIIRFRCGLYGKRKGMFVVFNSIFKMGGIPPQMFDNVFLTLKDRYTSKRTRMKIAKAQYNKHKERVVNQDPFCDMCKEYVICKQNDFTRRGLDGMKLFTEDSFHAKHLCPVLNLFRIHIAKHVFKPEDDIARLERMMDYHVQRARSSRYSMNQVTQAFAWWNTDTDAEFPKGMSFDAKCLIIFAITAWSHIRHRRRTDVGSYLTDASCVECIVGNRDEDVDDMSVVEHDVFEIVVPAEPVNIHGLGRPVRGGDEEDEAALLRELKFQESAANSIDRYYPYRNTTQLRDELILLQQQQQHQIPNHQQHNELQSLPAHSRPVYGVSVDDISSALVLLLTDFLGLRFMKTNISMTPNKLRSIRLTDTARARVFCSKWRLCLNYGDVYRSVIPEYLWRLKED
jgi:hypothetical protein